MLSGRARLPVESLARLVRQQHIGELPSVLAPAAVWRPSADEEAAGAQAIADAARLGWLDRHGKLNVDVVWSLTVVCRGRVEFTGWVDSEATGSAGVLAAATGREAVLAVARDGEVTLRRTAAKKLPEALVAQIPDVPAGAGAALSVPLADLRDAAEWQRPATVRARPVPRPELRQVLQITALPTHGSGELWVAARDNVGRRRETPFPLRYADTESGRYLNLMSGNDEVWLMVAPATRHDLATRLRELHQELS